jgi:hypothetical protein
MKNKCCCKPVKKDCCCCEYFQPCLPSKPSYQYEYRNCCDNNSVDKFALSALSQQTNTLTTLLTASLFNNNRNDRRDYWGDGNRCHHKHRDCHDYRYERNSPVVVIAADTGFGRYNGYGGYGRYGVYGGYGGVPYY